MQYLPEELLINIHEYLEDEHKFKFVDSYNNEMKENSKYKVESADRYFVGCSPIMGIKAKEISVTEYVKYDEFIYLDVCQLKWGDYYHIRGKRIKKKIIKLKYKNYLKKN